MCRKSVIAVFFNSICVRNAGYTGSVGIVHYDVDMDILAERNAVKTHVCCTIRNDGSASDAS